jgi:hypothetical protein
MLLCQNLAFPKTVEGRKFFPERRGRGKVRDLELAKYTTPTRFFEPMGGRVSTAYLS